MEKFTAAMVHSKETITKLSVTQYNCFEFRSKLIRLLIAVALIAYGLYANQNMFTPMLCLVLGCVLIANVNLRPRVRANRIIEQIGGSYPKSSYTFSGTGFSDGGGEEIAYSKIIRLVEDRAYMYLYISRDSAYMIDKSRIRGGSVDEFKELLSRRTSQKWSRPTSLLNFSIKNLIDRDEGFQGPRLGG